MAFSQIEILEEFIEASMVITDHSANAAAAEMRRVIARQLERNEIARNPWSIRRAKERRAVLNAVPGARERARRLTREWYERNKERKRSKQKAYEQSPEGKLARARYASSDRGKASMKRSSEKWEKTEKCIQQRARYNAKRREKNEEAKRSGQNSAVVSGAPG